MLFSLRTITTPLLRAPQSLCPSSQTITLRILRGVGGDVWPFVDPEETFVTAEWYLCVVSPSVSRVAMKQTKLLNTRDNMHCVAFFCSQTKGWNTQERARKKTGAVEVSTV